jgi:signal transduction histidine kinase
MMAAVRPTFRIKLFSIVAVAALALLVILVAGAVIADRVEHQLDSIQRYYLPKLSLAPQLEAQLERLQRGFQDAVAARDLEALAATRGIEGSFAALVRQADGGAVDHTEAAALQSAIEDYFTAGYDVSRRLIAGETGEKLLEAIAAMQAQQARTAALVQTAGALDRGDLTDAFARVGRAEATARSYRLWVSVACLAAVVVLSLWVGRGLVRSVASLTEGFDRFGHGDFAQPIQATSDDELGDLAKRANEMAASLDRLDKARKKAEDALHLSNRELEAFSYSVAHDLRTPLRGINGFSQALVEDYGSKLDEEARQHLDRIAAGAERMGLLIDALLGLSRVTRATFRREPVDLSRLVEAIVVQLRAAHPDRTVDFVTDAKVTAAGDAPLLRALLDNLLGNAWKFTGTRPGARITFGAEEKAGEMVYFVADNGAGFDMAYADKLFAPFQRLHSDREFAGTGIGLATAQRIVHRHGGRIWAEGAVGHGATFRFTLISSSPGTEEATA